MRSQDFDISYSRASEDSSEPAPAAGSSAVFAWGLPSAGPSPPGSHTLFAANAAAALDVSTDPLLLII